MECSPPAGGARSWLLGLRLQHPSCRGGRSSVHSGCFDRAGAARRGLINPSEISFVKSLNLFFSPQTAPELGTVKVPCQLNGYTQKDLLKMKNKEKAIVQCTHCIQSYLVIKCCDVFPSRKHSSHEKKSPVPFMSAADRRPAAPGGHLGDVRESNSFTQKATTMHRNQSLSESALGRL
ncbi:hypothetical protein AVEN_246778-1 [Araneus ventricosus]|uniref:Uncharacterized protein n=1 Tax=Araneus ventricosus TaxID=182803 RepID=A0A4Y2JR21_ARAVE|nr:hypothetical protein AVEN_246778-1 [Araneus ventricosus]